MSDRKNKKYLKFKPTTFEQKFIRRYQDDTYNYQNSSDSTEGIRNGVKEKNLNNVSKNDVAILHQ